VLFIAVGGWGRTWHSWRGWLALFLSGAAAGAAVAWQIRKMMYACGPLWEWVLSSVSLALALMVALALGRRISAHLADRYDHSEPASWWRFVALFGLVLYDILMAFDGRYMDFPIGLFALPCIGYALFGLLTLEEKMPSVEQRFLACAGPVLAVVPVVVEVGMNYVAWLWLGLNVAIAVPVWGNWCRHAVHLQAQEA
jgi:FtsH-binding integral membrane protein